jgi:transcription elongation factor Elf1
MTPQDNFGDLAAQSLFCPQCQKAQPVQAKLLLVLPSSEKYAYYCSVCGAELGMKMERISPESQPIGEQ